MLELANTLGPELLKGAFTMLNNVIDKQAENVKMAHEEQIHELNKSLLQENISLSANIDKLEIASVHHTLLIADLKQTIDRIEKEYQNKFKELETKAMNEKEKQAIIDKLTKEAQDEIAVIEKEVEQSQVKAIEESKKLVESLKEEILQKQEIASKDDEIKRLKDEIAYMRLQYVTELSEQKQEYVKKLKDQTNTYDQTLKKIEENLNTEKQAFETMDKKLQESIAKIRQEYRISDAITSTQNQLEMSLTQVQELYAIINEMFFEASRLGLSFEAFRNRANNVVA